jgi:hypothetical protein
MGLVIFEKVSVDRHTKTIYTSSFSGKDSLENIFLIDTIFNFSQLFQMYQYFKYREYLIEQDICR